MTFPRSFEGFLSDAVQAHRDWEASWPAFEADASVGRPDLWEGLIQKLTARLRENYPHFHPLYAGQMLKPPHPAAVVGYLAAMLVNPNNHALDGGRATAKMEKEAVSALGAMFGLPASPAFLGHLTSSGTIANLEALWVARELHPDLPIVLSKGAHYTHARMCGLLRARSVVLDATPEGRLDLDGLDALLARERVGTVVVTLGTTALGALDPLSEVLERRKVHGFRVHVDAAYGGYYRLLANSRPELSPFRGTGEVDSVVVDPHKHGLQPYGCGCVLFHGSDVARVYAHDSPYTYFSSPEHHPGETTLECSRAGAAAAALWLTLQGLPLVPGGAMAASLTRCLDAAMALARALPDAGYVTHLAPTLDIVTYYPRRAKASEITAATHGVFAQGEAGGGIPAPGSLPVYLAKLEVDAASFAALHPDVDMDAASVTLLRSCLMRPEQAEWVPTLVARLAELGRQV